MLKKKKDLGHLKGRYRGVKIKLESDNAYVELSGDQSAMGGLQAFCGRAAGAWLHLLRAREATSLGPHQACLWLQLEALRQQV